MDSHDGNLPEFPFEAAPRSDRCEKCGVGPDGDLRFVILRSRERYVGRTLCDVCAEEVLEVLLTPALDSLFAA